MKATYFVLILLLLWWLISRNKKQKQRAVMMERRKLKNSKGGKMKELAKKFIGKDCIINIFDDSQLEGRLLEVSEDGGAILIERADKQIEAVNLDYVIRLREYPVNKKGKKKAVVLD